jgi:hypothetical protein
MALELDALLVDRLLRFVAPYYRGRDPAHDLIHIRRLLERLVPLSVGVDPAPRPHLLAFLACFHGMAGPLRDDRGCLEATRRLAAELGWTDEDGDAALEMVPRHLADPRTSEEQVVHDANSVELLGALGIAKAFTTGGARGQHYLETADIFENEYLDRVVFRTPAGRALADRERPYAKAFLRKLRDELGPAGGPHGETSSAR